MFFDSTTEVISVLMCVIGFVILLIGSVLKEQWAFIGLLIMILSAFIFVVFFDFQKVLDVDSKAFMILKVTGSIGILFTLFIFFKKWQNSKYINQSKKKKIKSFIKKKYIKNVP